MPIVPPNQDITVKTIRDVINLKSIMLGQVLTQSTTFGRYGSDLNTGRIYLKFQNIAASDYIPTYKVTVTGVTGGVVTFTLNPGEIKSLNWTSLSNGTRNVKIEEISGAGTAGRSQNHDVSTNPAQLKQFEFGREAPTTDISVSKDAGSNTANYTRSAGVNIPNSLPATDQNASVFNWRGSSVFAGFYTLYPDGFTTGGAVTISYKGRSVTRTLSANNFFEFNSITGSTDTAIVTDTITGTSISTSITPGYSSVRWKSYSFNGSDYFYGFNW
jgi:hypothetical protein